LGIHIGFSLEKVFASAAWRQRLREWIQQNLPSYRTVGKVAFRWAGVKVFAQCFVLCALFFDVVADEFDLLKGLIFWQWLCLSDARQVFDDLPKARDSFRGLRP
jgi:hypothetical protein